MTTPTQRMNENYPSTKWTAPIFRIFVGGWVLMLFLAKVHESFDLLAASSYNESTLLYFLGSWLVALVARAAAENLAL